VTESALEALYVKCAIQIDAFTFFYRFNHFSKSLVCLTTDGADASVVSPLLCPPGLECLLDAGQLVTHMGNLRHDYSQFTSNQLHPGNNILPCSVLFR